MLKFKKADVSEDGVITSVYAASHTKPGRSGTNLALDLIVSQDRRFGSTKARIVMEPEVAALDTEAALDKLADWAERLAIALRHRGPSSNAIPVFTDPQRPPRPEEPEDSSESESD